MFSAAVRPCPMAMVASPRLMLSPPVQILGCAVFPHLSASSQRVVARAPPSARKSGSWLTAVITVSQSYSTSSPVPTGERRPEASGSPSFMRSTTSFVTRPEPSRTILEGAARNSILTFSSTAPTTSSSIAGISARVRR